jgi:hypothetical protein
MFDVDNVDDVERQWVLHKIPEQPNRTRTKTLFGPYGLNRSRTLLNLNAPNKLPSSGSGTGPNNAHFRLGSARFQLCFTYMTDRVPGVFVLLHDYQFVVRKLLCFTPNLMFGGIERKHLESIYEEVSGRFRSKVTPEWFSILTLI